MRREVAGKHVAGLHETRRRERRGPVENKRPGHGTGLGLAAGPAKKCAALVDTVLGGVCGHARAGGLEGARGKGGSRLRPQVGHGALGDPLGQAAYALQVGGREVTGLHAGAGGFESGRVLVGHTAKDGVAEARGAAAGAAHELDALAHGDLRRRVQVEDLEGGDAQGVANERLERRAGAQVARDHAVDLAAGGDRAQHEAGGERSVARVELRHRGHLAQKVAGAGLAAAALGEEPQGGAARGRELGCGGGGLLARLAVGPVVGLLAGH